MFVRGGGTLVCFNRSTQFAIDRFKLPVKNVTTGLNRQTFFVGTSLLNVTVDASQRVDRGHARNAPPCSSAAARRSKRSKASMARS